MMLEKKVNTTPVDYAVLNQLSQDLETRFVPQAELSTEQAFWSQNFVNSTYPTLSSRPTKVEVPKELPKVSMVNTSLKKLKHHLSSFDVVVKERTTATAITEGSWGFEHTKACFRDEIIPFVKSLKDLFNTFDQYLIDELSEVQNVFNQMEQAVEQHRLESKTFEVKMNQVLNENKQLLEQVINKDIVNIIMNSSVDNASVNVHECEKFLKLETELLNKEDFVEKEIYDKLFKSFTTLEKHCISLEVDTKFNQEIFQRDNSVSNQSAPSFDQLFELNEMKAQSQEKDTVIKKLKERIKSLSGKMNEDKIKKDLEEIEIVNIELDHRVLKLIAKNEHLKQTYKQLYDSIKLARIRSKEQCDGLINQVNLKSVEISDLNARLQEKVMVITALKDELGTAHSVYVKHTQEEAAVLRDLVKHVKANYPPDHPLESACRPTGRTFTIVGNACPLTRITITTKVPPRKPTAIENETPKHVVTLVYSRKPRKSKTNVPVSKSKVLKFVSATKKEPSQSWGSIVSDVPSLSLDDYRSSKLFFVKFRNDHVVKILGYGDYQIGNVTISRVKCLRSKDEAPDFIIKFLKMIQKVGISHETSVARSPQQIGVIERRNLTLIEAARTMLIYAKAPLFLWAEAVATAYFDELTAMASKHISSGPTLHEIHVATISSGLVPNPPPSTPFEQPLRIALEPVASTDSPSSTTVDQDAPYPSNSQTTPETQSPIIPNDVEDDNHDLDVAHINNDPYFGIPNPEVPSDQSSSTDISNTIVHPDHQISKHNSKWTKDHPLENIIGELDRPVSTRPQSHEPALFCYYDDFLTAVEPKTYKDALTQSCWIEAMQEELNEFERLRV
ncbi:retrovirus-related pol polyprotein from transposon TNT 1-94 [Tanacetum coccineum]